MKLLLTIIFGLVAVLSTCATLVLFIALISRAFYGNTDATKVIIISVPFVLAGLACYTRSEHYRAITGNMFFWWPF